MIAAGIVTFEPDLDRLKQNLECIDAQVERTIIVDNGSLNAEAVVELARAHPRVSVLRLPENLGIAAALNRASEWAARGGFDWMVTLDQDSVAPAGMVSELVAVAKLDRRAALVTPYIVDRNKQTVADYQALSLPRVTEYRQAARRGAITSGALTDVNVLRRVGGFDERFFIDYVDYDLNQRLLLSGYKILRANRTYLLHEVGRARRTWLRVPRKDVAGTWHLETFYSFGHSEMRCYYKARNRVLFTRKYWRAIGLTHEGVWQIPQQVALTVLFESGRWRKLLSFIRGVWDGIRLTLA